MNATAIAPRITVTFAPDEQKALRALCDADLRPPKWTIRHLVLAEAERRGLLLKSEETGQTLASSPVSSKTPSA